MWRTSRPSVEEWRAHVASGGHWLGRYFTMSKSWRRLRARPRKALLYTQYLAVWWSASKQAYVDVDGDIVQSTMPRNVFGTRKMPNQEVQ